MTGRQRRKSQERSTLCRLPVILQSSDPIAQIEKIEPGWRSRLHKYALSRLKENDSSEIDIMLFKLDAKI
jgi:hypothetical protein